MRNNLLSSVKWVWSENSKDQVSVGSYWTYLILKVTQNRLGSGIGLDLNFLSTSSLAVVHSWSALKKEIVSGRFFSCLNPSSLRLNLDKVTPERRLLGEYYWTISYRNFNSGLINSLTHLSESSSKSFLPFFASENVWQLSYFGQICSTRRLLGEYRTILTKAGPRLLPQTFTHFTAALICI